MENILHQAVDEINKAVKGKRKVVEAVLMAILADGHVLMEDIPGVGKTTLALAFSKVLGIDYHRVQFTPDVLPGDITGFSMYNRKTEEFEYVRGAAFCSLLLADEINRTSPKTQSALLEIMEEKKVTVDGVTRKLPEPFVVIATQNPFGASGTQKIPESQMDRFMVRLSMGYPEREAEMEILRGGGNRQLGEVHGILSREVLLIRKEEVRKVYVSDEILALVTDIARLTRNHELVSLGFSPRGSLALLGMSKAHAYYEGKDFVTPEDVLYVLPLAGGHRLVLSPKAKAAGMNEQEVLMQLTKEMGRI